MRRYGWRRSPQDNRDKRADPAGLTLLPEVDPRGDAAMPVVFDQGRLGSCTANAVAAALQYDCGLDSGKRCRRRSRLDIYYGERMLEGSLGEDDPGAYGRDGFKYAQQTGVLFETYGSAPWPYNIATYQDPPPDGTRRKLRKPYASVQQDVDHIKAVLSNKQTVAFGFSVYASFESSTVDRTGVVPMPLANEQYLGGHEVLAVGYLEDFPAHVLCRNSWGDWGMAGYFLFPWRYLVDPDLCDDLRTIVRAIV